MSSVSYLWVNTEVICIHIQTFGVRFSTIACFWPEHALFEGKSWIEKVSSDSEVESDDHVPGVRVSQTLPLLINSAGCDISS